MIASFLQLNDTLANLLLYIYTLNVKLKGLLCTVLDLYIVCIICFSCVYKCVCKQFSERLYSDLIQYMSKHLEEKNEEFQAWVCMSIYS